MKIAKDIISDEIILQTFNSNEQEGMRLLFDTYYLSLCIYCIQLTDNFEQSEDIIQDLLLTFWEKKIYKQIRISLRSYLFNSVRNAAIARLNNENRIPLYEIHDIEFTSGSDCFDRDEIEQKELDLKKKLSILSPQELKVVESVILQNKKYKEAAEELQISVNTLKTYLARALRQLRKEYGLRIFF